MKLFVASVPGRRGKRTVLGFAAVRVRLLADLALAGIEGRFGNSQDEDADQKASWGKLLPPTRQAQPTPIAELAVFDALLDVRVCCIDVAEGRISQACNRTAVMQELPNLIPAFSHRLKPAMRDGPQFAPACSVIRASMAEPARQRR